MYKQKTIVNNEKKTMSGVGGEWSVLIWVIIVKLLLIMMIMMMMHACYLFSPVISVIPAVIVIPPSVIGHPSPFLTGCFTQFLHCIIGHVRIIDLLNTCDSDWCCLSGENQANWDEKDNAYNCSWFHFFFLIDWLFIHKPVL